MLELLVLGLILGTIFNFYEMRVWLQESFDDLSDSIQAKVGDVFGDEEDRLRLKIKFEDNSESSEKITHKKERFYFDLQPFFFFFFNLKLEIFEVKYLEIVKST